MAITKVSGHVIEPTTNITSHNINSSGIITATRFDGPIGAGLTDGNFSGIVTSTQLNVTGVSTFGGNIDANGNLDVDGHAEFDNVRVSGVTTTAAVSWGGHMLPTVNAAYDIGSADYKVRHLFLSDNSLKFVDSSDNEHPLSVDSGRLKFAGGLLLGNTLKLDSASGVITATSANFSGNVTIGGTLTYEDVTNIDSVGVITARSGVRVSNDIKSSDDDFYVYSYKGGSDGQVRSGIQFDSTNQRLEFFTATDERVRITHQGFVGVGTINPSGNFHVQTTGGTYDPLVVERKGSANWGIKPYANTLFFRSNSDGSNSFNSRDRFSIGWDGTDARGGDVNFYGTAAGITSCLWDASANSLIFQDNSKAVFGAGSDLELYHGGTASYISHAGTGNLYIHSNTVAIRKQNQQSYFLGQNGAASLYKDGNQKIITTDTGVSVTGEVAASQDYPNIRPTLDFNFAAVKKLDPRITYTRSGPASYVDENGYLKLVGANTPRFDHDPYTGESKGLLIEESRTNLMKAVIHPHLPKSTYNSNSNGSIVEVSDDVLAPDGSAYTLKLHWTNYTANQNGYRRVGNTSTETGTLSAGTYGFSFFVKRGTDGNHNMEEFLAGTAYGIGSSQYHFTTQDFSPSYAVNVTLCDNSDVKIEKYPDGWYRLSGTLTAAQSFTPDNTGASYYVLGSSNFKTFFEAMPFYHWGFQLEVGACPSSYIGGTVSATTTRGWEVPIITGTELTDVFNPTEGTMFYEASVSSLTNDNQPIVAFRDLGSTTNNYHAMGYRIGGGSSGNIRTWFKSNNANTYLSNHGSTGMVAGSPYKHMYGYKLNDASDAYNTGAASAQTTSSSVTPMITSGVIDELRFGGYYSGPETTTYSLEAGHIKRFSYWKTKLSNTQIKTYVS